MSRKPYNPLGGSAVDRARSGLVKFRSKSILADISRTPARSEGRTALGRIYGSTQSPDLVFARMWHLQGVPHAEIEQAASMAAHDTGLVRSHLGYLKTDQRVRPASEEGWGKRLAALAIFMESRPSSLFPPPEIVLNRATSIFYPGTRRRLDVKGVSRVNPALILHLIGVPGDKVARAAAYASTDTELAEATLRLLWDRSVSPILPRTVWKLSAQALSIYFAEATVRREFADLKRMVDWLYSDKSKTEEFKEASA